jgi:hypothetical protein
MRNHGLAALPRRYASLAPMCTEQAACWVVPFPPGGGTV